jgi:hypothetical protein
MSVMLPSVTVACPRADPVKFVGGNERRTSWMTEVTTVPVRGKERRRQSIRYWRYHLQELRPFGKHR